MWECHLHKCPHSGHNTQIHSNYPTFTNCTNSANIPHGSGKVKYRRRWQKYSFMFRLSTCHFNPLRFKFLFSCPSSFIPTSVRDSLMIHHSERSTRQCAHLRQHPTCLCTTSNFLIQKRPLRLFKQVF